MENLSRLKLVYILPEFREEAGNHFVHKRELLDVLRSDVDIALVVERGVCPVGMSSCRVLRFRFPILRALEYFWVFWRLSRKGYRTFWTHYAFLGSIIAPFFGRSFYWNCGMPWKYRRGWFTERVFRLALRRSILVTGTEGLKKEYIARYALSSDRVRVLPNAINVSRFAEWRGKKMEARRILKLSEEKKIVLFLHHLSERKGAHRIGPVAEAFADDPSVLFVVAGSGPYEKRIAAKNILLVGEVAPIDVPKYFAAADIFFMPSEEEGFPHVLLEAMAAGTPFVAANVGGVSEVIPFSLRGMLVDPHDIEEYAKKILFLLSEMGKNVASDFFREVEQYDTVRVASILRSLIAT